MTLRQIAERVGMSVMTVSYALRNSTEVSAQTRQRVQAQAEAMGYTPDPALSVLAAYRHGQKLAKVHALVAVVSVTKRPMTALIAGYTAGAKERARQLGLIVRVHNVRPDLDSLRQAAESLYDQGVRAIQLIYLDGSIEELPFVWSRFSIVTMSGDPTVSRTRNVMINAEQGMRLVLGELSQRGYRRPGLAFIEEVSARSAHQWPRSWGLAPFTFPDADLRPFAVPRGIPLEHQQDLLDAWVRERGHDVVLFAEHGWPCGWLRERGWRIPRDIGFVALHHRASEPEIAALAHPHTALNAAAMDLLHNLLHANERGESDSPYTLLVNCGWHEGKTLRPRRRKLARTRSGSE